MKKIKLLLMIGIFTTLACTNSTKAQQNEDWPNLAQFQEANAALEAPAENENRVVFMGNSITIGWINSRPEFFEGKPWINRGIGGQTTPQMLVRFRQDVIALKPRVVVL